MFLKKFIKNFIELRKLMQIMFKKFSINNLPALIKSIAKHEKLSLNLFKISMLNKLKNHIQ